MSTFDDVCPECGQTNLPINEPNWKKLAFERAEENVRLRCALSEIRDRVNLYSTDPYPQINLCQQIATKALQ